MTNKKWYIVLTILLVGVTNVAAETVESIQYRLAWPEPHTRYFHVEMEIKRSNEGELDVRMPAWRPGRYILQDYARYIVAFEAVDQTGKMLSFSKSDKTTWRIQAGDEKVITVRYRAYANVLDAGESYLDDTEAYINPITVLMYVPGAEFTSGVVSFDKPADWKVATALDYDEDKQGYPVRDYHELVDSPFIISPDFETLSFEHEGATYELVFQGEGNYDPEKIVNDVRAIAEAQTAIMKITPFKRYVFLYHLLERPFGHGVEHKNSTSIVIGPADFNNERLYRGFIGVTSHELFHVWNVERIRPEAIFHPDYSREAYTTTMWVYEGITSYYTDLTLAHAGLISIENYLDGVARTLEGYDRTYARRITSVASTSWNSWINSSAPPHTTYSFYTAGKVLGMLLDLEIRGRTENAKSLDDVFRYLYAEYAARDKGVPEEGFQLAVETVAGSSFESFFDSYVYGVKDIDYNAFLSHAGIMLKEEYEEGDVDLGMDIRRAEQGASIRRITPGRAAEQAGLAADDVLLSINGDEISNENFWSLIGAYHAGDTIQVGYVRRGEERSASLTLGQPLPAYSWSRVPEPAPLQEEIYSDWLK